MGQLKLVTVTAQHKFTSDNGQGTLVVPLICVDTVEHEVLNPNSHYHPMTALQEQEAIKTTMFPVPHELK